ncbi:MAG TPA: GSCFA domain-containing protein, partial [Saprospiraceae bacterium]|nr:GSCFA domain-containing protein [Saprospiraceae bacterium]
MSWSGPEFTRVDIPVLPDRIRYADRILLNGSCFSEHIANKLKRFKYRVVDNPFGILYNPVSLAESFRRTINRMYYQADELIFHDGLYHSVDHHGSFSNPEASVALEKIRDQMDQAFQHLQHCHYIFISPGTSWVYKLKSSGHIVGNCHKIPQSFFKKSKLEIEDCV